MWVCVHVSLSVLSCYSTGQYAPCVVIHASTVSACTIRSPLCTCMYHTLIPLHVHSIQLDYSIPGKSWQSLMCQSSSYVYMYFLSTRNGVLVASARTHPSTHSVADTTSHVHWMYMWALGCKYPPLYSWYICKHWGLCTLEMCTSTASVYAHSLRQTNSEV